MKASPFTFILSALVALLVGWWLGFYMGEQQIREEYEIRPFVQKCQEEGGYVYYDRTYCFYPDGTYEKRE